MQQFSDNPSMTFFSCFAGLLPFFKPQIPRINCRSWFGMCFGRNSVEQGPEKALQVIGRLDQTLSCFRRAMTSKGIGPNSVRGWRLSWVGVSFKERVPICVCLLLTTSMQHISTMSGMGLEQS